MTEENMPPDSNYVKIERPLGKIIINNFLGGIFWSFGVLIGTGIILSIVAFFAKNVDFIPILGHFLAKVLESSQQALQNR